MKGRTLPDSNCGIVWPAGGGEVGSLFRAKDWSQNPLGPVEGWPPGLRVTVDLVLGSPLPMVALWGPELVQIYNDGYAVIVGAKHPYALGQPVRECWPEVWACNGSIYDAVWRGEARLLEDQKLSITRDGALEEAWFDLTFSPLRDETGGTAGVLVVVVETTAEVRAWAALRESEDDRRHAFGLNPQVQWIADACGAIIEFNGRGLEITGLTHEQAMGDGWLEAAHPVDFGALRAAWARSIRTGEAYDVEHRIRLADGTYRWMRSRAFPRHGDERRAVRWYGTTEDVHDRRLAEEALRAEGARSEDDDRFRQMADVVPQSPSGKFGWLINGLPAVGPAVG